MARPRTDTGRRRPPAGEPERPAWLSLSLPPDALRSAGVVILPLRAFLGVTFCYAGLQKLANKDFFNSASPASIQAQIIGYARTSPLHGLLGHLGHVAWLVGLVVALGELAAGLGALLGLWTRLAALGGMAISLGLFLTVSFHSSPYYTGADIVWFFAWTPLLIAGSGGLWSLEGLIDGYVFHQAATARRPPSRADLDRRRLVLRGVTAGAVGAAGLVLAGIAAALGRAFGGPATRSNTATLGGGNPAPPTTQAAGPSTTAAPRSGTAKGTAIGPARDVPVGGAASFQDPGTGDPALVVQHTSGQFLAFDAVCPHAGCTVQYSSADNILVCPCHGSEFSARSGAVEVGPAQSGLKPIPIQEGPDGQLYVSA